MKKILLIVLLCFIKTGIFAQSEDKSGNIDFNQVLVDKDNTGNFKLDMVTNVDNVPKEEMYKRAKKWVLANLKTSDNNINFNDEDLSIINNSSILIEPISKAFVGVISQGVADFKFNLQFKDNKYRLIIDNVTVYLEHAETAPPNSFSYNTLMQKEGNKAIKNPGKKRYALDIHIIKQINQQLESIETNLKAAIEGVAQKSNDNW